MYQPLTTYLSNATLIFNLLIKWLIFEVFVLTLLDEKLSLSQSIHVSLRGHLPFVWKGSITHIYGRAVYVKERLTFAHDISIKILGFIFSMALCHSVSYFFFLYRSPSSSFSTIFEAVSFNTDKVLQFNLSTNVFASERFNVEIIKIG